MAGIQTEVNRFIDNNLAIKKNLKDGLINIRALSRRILADSRLGCSIDAVISAIRRYDNKVESKKYSAAINRLLAHAKLASKTRLASVLIKKNSSTRNKLAHIFPGIDFEGGDTLRIFEVTKYIKLIIDDRALQSVNRLFAPGEVLLVEKGLGELAIVYDEDITKIPGLFATVSNELAMNDISIVDSMICYNEHIVIVNEPDIQRTFDVIFSLLNRKL